MSVYDRQTIRIYFLRHMHL